MAIPEAKSDYPMCIAQLNPNEMSLKQDAPRGTAGAIQKKFRNGPPSASRPRKVSSFFVHQKQPVSSQAHYRAASLRIKSYDRFSTHVKTYNQLLPDYNQPPPQAREDHKQKICMPVDKTCIPMTAEDDASCTTDDKVIKLVPIASRGKNISSNPSLLDHIKSLWQRGTLAKAN